MAYRTWESAQSDWLRRRPVDPYPLRAFRDEVDSELMIPPSVKGRDLPPAELPRFEEDALEDRANEGLGRYSREAPRRNYESARDRYEGVLDEMPDRSKHRGGVGSAIAAGLLGGAVGYANAGRRVRIPEPQAFYEEMAAPGYRRAREDWEDKETKERAKFKGAEQLLRDAERQDELDLRRKSTEANVGVSNARAEYWRAKRDAEGKEKPRRSEVHNTAGGLFERDEKGVLKKVPGTEKPPAPAKADPNSIDERKRRAREIGLSEGSEEWKHYLANGRIPAPPRPRSAGRGEGKPKIAPPAEFGKVEDRKGSDLTKLEKESKDRAEAIKAQIAAAERKGDKPAVERLRREESELWTSHERRKGDIQKRYEEGITARGGSVTPREKPAAPKAEAKPKQTKYSVGQTVKLRSGKTVTIRKINPDGTFEYD